MSNRAERIQAVLTREDHHADNADALVIAEILAIADDRELISLKDVALRIGRNQTTILSWYNRGRQHGFPAAIAITSAGMIWDAEHITAWAQKWPKLCKP
jgi:predicted DNA-binding transcriptional regulator AlpA